MRTNNNKEKVMTKTKAKVKTTYKVVKRGPKAVKTKTAAQIATEIRAEAKRIDGLARQARERASELRQVAKILSSNGR